MPSECKRAKMSLATAAPMASSDAATFTLRVKKLSEHGRAPERCSAAAAGYDLFSAIDTVIPAKGKAVVPTDISVAIPEGHYGRVAPRSGLAHKHFIDIGAGVVDADYRGPLGVILFNFGEGDFQVKRGDRIAQLILERISTPPVEVVEVSAATELQDVALTASSRPIGHIGAG